MNNMENLKDIKNWNFSKIPNRSEKEDKYDLDQWELVYLKLKKMAFEQIAWMPEKAEFWNDKLDNLDKSWEDIRKFYESNPLKTKTPDIGSMEIPLKWENPGDIKTNELF